MRLLLLASLLLAAPVLAQPTYRVYPAPVESPIHTTPSPPADARQLLVDPADPTASPFGWHDVDGLPGADFTTTAGNNARAYFDRDADNTPDPDDFPDGGPSLVFDFPLDLDQSPTAYGEAVVTDLFYWTNHVHDVLYGFGFDEAAGNFQQSTYDRGGLGGDAIRVEAQDGSGTNGSNFFSPPDGNAPRLQTFLWTFSTPPRDGALDHGIVVHELIHGLTNRLVGGPGNASCLSNPEQGGEGWSDWYALLFTMTDEDTAVEGRGLGTYLLGQPPDGPGIRPAPYSTDFAINDATYGDTQTAVVPHGVGFIWASVLWEVTWALIDAHGFDPDLLNPTGSAGNLVALNLVTEGLKLQPCAPGFVDARDAILVADDVLYGGAHTEILWAAFARRGLGFSADQGSATSNADNVEAFDVPNTTGSAPNLPIATLLLDPIAPNPVRGQAQVAFSTAQDGPVRLALYDVRGREVRLLDARTRTAGRHRLMLHVDDLAAGVYLLRLETVDGVQSQRVTVIR